MNNLRTIIATLLFGITSLSANAGNFNTKLAKSTIEIDSNFNGDNLMLFGHINSYADIESPSLLVNVRNNDTKHILVRKASKQGIFWSSKPVKLWNGEKFYHLYGDYKRQITPIDSKLANLDYLSYIAPGSFQSVPSQEDILINQLTSPIRKNEEKYLLLKKDSIKNIGGFDSNDLFAFNITIPSLIPSGSYLVSSYLLDNYGQIAATDYEVIEIVKTGIGVFVQDLSRTSPALYALIAVFNAIFFGSLGSIIFTKLRKK